MLAYAMTTAAPRAPARPGISQSIPFAAREQWAAELVRLMDALLVASAQAGARNAESASAQTGARNVETALDNLLALPAHVLAGRARADARRTRARLERLHDTDNPEAEPATPTPPLTRNRPEHHRTASRIHRCLVMGSISRAARFLETQPILAPSDVLNRLRALHPREPEGFLHTAFSLIETSRVDPNFGSGKTA
jgi:hypothetical protein